MDGIKGISSSIISTGAAAYKEASSDAYRTVFLSTIAINGVGIILTFFVPNPDLDAAEMTDVSAPLHGAAKSDKEKELEEGAVSD